MAYQLSLPGFIPQVPETVKDSLTAYFRDTHFWRDFVSFDFYSILRNVRSANRKEITDPLKIHWYVQTLSTADRMMDDANCSISLLSDNSADGLLDILERNLRKNHYAYLRSKTNIRVISVNETNQERFIEYNQYSPLVQLTMAQPISPSKGINPFLVCYSGRGGGGFSSLEIEIPTTQLSRLSPEQTSATFYAHGCFPRMHQEIFDAYWNRLNNIPEPEKPKSLPRRILEKLLGLN